MGFLKQTFSEFSRDRCTTLAAALAYFTIFALPPLLYLLLLIVGFGLSLAYDSDVAEQKAQKLLVRQAAAMIGNQAATEEVSAILERDRQMGGKWWKSLLSVAAIVVGATGVVAALQDSLNKVWSVRADTEGSGIKYIIRKRIMSLAMILGMGFLLLVSLVVSAVLAALGDRLGELFNMDQVAAGGVDLLVQALISFVIFGAIFKFMPDVKINWRLVTIGASVTTLLFLVGRFGLQTYLSYAEPGAQLGSAAASLAIILVWVYYSALIFLFGAEVTQVYAQRLGVPLEPEDNAVRVTERLERAV